MRNLILVLIGALFSLFLNAQEKPPLPLDTVVVLPSTFSAVFFGVKDESVTDYLFVNEGFLVVSRIVNTNQNVIRLLSKSGKILIDSGIDFEVSELYQSCINRYYLIGNKGVFEISFLSGSFSFRRVSGRYFTEAIQHYEAYKHPWFYIIGFTPDNLVQGFFLEDLKNKTIGKFPFAIVGQEAELLRMANQVKNKEMRKILDNPVKQSNWASNPAEEQDGWYKQSKEDYLQQSATIQQNIPIYSPILPSDSFFFIIDMPGKNLMTFVYPDSLIKIEPFEGLKDSAMTFKAILDIEKRYVLLSNNTSLFYLKPPSSKLDVLSLQLPKGAALPKTKNNYLYYLQAPSMKTYPCLIRQKIN